MRFNLAFKGLRAASNGNTVIWKSGFIIREYDVCENVTEACIMSRLCFNKRKRALIRTDAGIRQRFRMFMYVIAALGVRMFGKERNED